MLIEPDKIHEFFPSVDPNVWSSALDGACERYEINTPLRIVHFMAQIYEETNGLRWVVENLNYSATALMQLWPLRFPTVEEANLYARNPEKIANKIYANRMGNGDEASGDGWRYRGRGPLQLTGLSNYDLYAKVTGLDILNNPDLVEQPSIGSEVSAAYWEAGGCNELADNDDIVSITRRINGGLIGLVQRRQALNQAKQIWRVT